MRTMARILRKGKRFQVVQHCSHEIVFPDSLYCHRAAPDQNDVAFLNAYSLHTYQTNGCRRVTYLSTASDLAVALSAGPRSALNFQKVARMNSYVRFHCSLYMYACIGIYRYLHLLCMLYSIIVLPSSLYGQHAAPDQNGLLVLNAHRNELCVLPWLRV